MIVESESQLLKLGGLLGIPRAGLQSWEKAGERDVMEKGAEHTPCTGVSFSALLWLEDRILDGIWVAGAGWEVKGLDPLSAHHSSLNP